MRDNASQAQYYEVKQCYKNGGLAQALRVAAEFVDGIGEARVCAINTHYEQEIGEWWAEVVYRRQNH